jgi:hypothetical protein
MNKSFFTFALFTWGILVWLTSCGNDPEPRPGLRFAAGNNLITSNQKATGSQVYSSSLFAQTSSDNPFTRFRITRTYDGKDSITYLDSTFNATEFGLYFTFGTRGLSGKETWRFVITDQNNKEYSRRFTLETISANTTTKPLNTFTSYFYKKSALENLQYISLRDGTVYPGFVGRNNPQVKPYVDFYFDQNASKAISVNAVATAGTQFKPTTLTPEAFAEVATVENLQNAYTGNSGTPVAAVPNLRKNQVIAFKTNSRTGLIRINALNKVYDLGKKDSVLVRMNYDVKAEK